MDTTETVFDPKSPPTRDDTYPCSANWHGLHVCLGAALARREARIARWDA